METVFLKILVAIDGSPLTKKVLCIASDLARLSDAELHLVYVVESGWAEGDVARELAIREMEEESDRLITEWKKMVSPGLAMTAHRMSGHPGNTIVNLASDIGADLIVIGSVGKSQVERMLAGSVSTFVVTHSRIPTLVIKP
ncbi:MAG: universal stress protein [Methanoregulaceae archaeon]|jgi:nucleotide-binding universal stress UspA family protein|nr:universal stress protein [Methanoregulaceae archaeon]MDD3091225.1 universal stress protein [Methanoregulaceae archaeon]MDD5685124.1 universal stress protein [Methanoregulaceae archaeon]HPJ74549.1 universal stress protein [Methanoregulaceae archaeon]HRX33275.1 universal stress protein [Methanoregulaceae archaeon]